MFTCKLVVPKRNEVYVLNMYYLVVFLLNTMIKMNIVEVQS